MSLRARLIRYLALVALIAIAVSALYAARESVLRTLGRTLVLEESISPADVIVISLDAGGAGVLEAADLVRQGIATRVAVFADPPSGEDFEFIRRGLPYEDEAGRRIQQLALLGVTSVERIPTDDERDDAGTEAEGRALPAWCERNSVGSVIVVSSSDHSRRMRRVFDRYMQGHATRVTIRASLYSPFKADRWWQTRGGVRTAIIELEKLALDVVLHPWQ